MHSTRALVLTTVAFSTAAAITAFAVAKCFARNPRDELAALLEAWDQLQRNIAAIPTEAPSLDYINPGTHVVVRGAREVSNSSLWDASNTQYCEQCGIIVTVDEDGDATVRLDSGEDIVVDVKFVVPEAESALKGNVAAMQAAIRSLTGALRPSRAPVSFD